MKIAVVGGGGREHAIIKKLKLDNSCGEIIAIPGNGGIASDAQCIDIQATDITAVADFCIQNSVEYVVVAPDDPLALGMVDALAQRGIPAFGPTKAASQIEASKVFSKDLMRKYGIPTAAYESFGDSAAAISYIESQNKYPVVVKADGLALGKGVIICQNHAEAVEAVRGMIEEKKFGESGARIVIEEFLTGPEVSVLSFCDGTTLVPMVSSMDHKRALDGDRGLNTGGMGTVAPNPLYSAETAERCMAEIFMPTVNAMRAEGAPFKGCLYFGLMLTPGGPKVIEYNCRFGDPETQVVLPLLESDLLGIFIACTEDRLSPDMVKFSDGAAACVVLASGGYPEKYETGKVISGLEQAKAEPDVEIYHAGTKLQDKALVTAGGRVLGVAATAGNLAVALKKAYSAAEKISFDGAHYRKDIGGKVISE